jgi:hypothetical protein
MQPTPWGGVVHEQLVVAQFVTRAAFCDAIGQGCSNLKKKNPCWTVWGANRGGDEIFRIHPNWPCQPVRWVPSLFLGGKAAWAWRRPLTPI